MNAGVKADSVLLNNDLLLDEGVNLLFKEVTLVNVVRLQLLVVFLQVRDVFDDLLEDIIGGLSRVMLESSALGSEELHFLLVVIQHLDSLSSLSLIG